MPVVPAAGYRADTIPSVAPDPNAPNDYQNERASPESFGAPVADALGRLSSGIDRAAGVLQKHAVELQDVKNQSEADDLFLKGMQDTGKASAEFMSLTGKDAQAAFPAYQDTLLKLRQQYKGMASNPDVARRADQFFTRRLGYLLEDAGRHAATEQRKAFVLGNRAVQANTIGDIAQNPDDEDRFLENLDIVKKQAGQEMISQGYPADDPVTIANINKATSTAYERRIFELTKTQPQKALAIWQQHSKEITDPAIRERIEGHIAQGFLHNDARDAANQIVGGIGTGVSSRAVNTDIPVEGRALLDTIAGPESKGAYDVRYTPGGGAKFSGFAEHPRIAEPGPEGPSTAAGRYQIVASTWDRIAPKIGATDFSPKNQDAAAWQIAQNAYKSQTGGDLLTALKEGKTGEIQRALRDTKQWTTANMSSFASNLRKYQSGEGAPPERSLESMLAQGEERVEALRGQGILGPNSPIPDAEYRNNLLNNIRGQYNLSRRAEQEGEKLNLYAARNAVTALDENGAPIVKSLDQFLANDDNRSIFYRLGNVNRKVIADQIARNATIVPMTPERLDKWERLMDMQKAAPDEFVKLDPLSQDFSLVYKKRLADMIRQTEQKAQNPETWRHDLSRALTQIKQEGLILNTGIEPNSKTDERSHRFVAALSDSVREFTQEKKRSMNPDELRKTVAGLMRTATKGSWWNPFSADQLGFETFIPKRFRDDAVSAHTKRFGGPPTQQQLIEMYHNSDEYKHSAPETAPEPVEADRF